MTFTRALATNNYGPAKFIVDGTTVANGTHSTIAAALTSASSGDTIFIRPGTYTENLTLKAGVNLTAFGADSSLNGTGHVIISGTCTLTTAGSVTIFGIQLQTNSAALLAVTGSAASIVNLNNCYLNCTNSTGITFSSSSSSAAINISGCTGDLGTTGIAMFSHSSSGSLFMINTVFNNSGGSSTASTASAGTLQINNSRIASPITTSSTGILTISNSSINTSTQNVTAITHGGASTSKIEFTSLISGTASALSTSGTISVVQCRVESSNTNALTGAGTINFSDITYVSSSVSNVTTQSGYYTDLGKSLATNQPSFCANNSGTLTNITGDATNYTVGFNTAQYNIGSNYNTGTFTFTAPVTGKYLFTGRVQPTSLDASVTDGETYIFTSNRNYDGSRFNFGTVRLNSVYCGTQVATIADMDAADTATIVLQVTQGSGKTVDVASSFQQSSWQGILLS